MNVISVTYKYYDEDPHKRQKEAILKVWQCESKLWQWEALGCDGEERSMNEAIAAARNWVQFSVSNSKF